MSDDVRKSIETREADWLSPYAALASRSAGRQRPEEPDPVRTAFQRDRDRILHSKAFRRLKHKTQVFIDPAGDHFRTRLTHSLEVAQIARTIARALRLNEDLAEAIALGHDVGHTPFGHAGEAAIDQAIREDQPGEPDQFRHYDQSLRIVDHLEPLNLTQEVRDGIGGHSKGRKDLSSHDGELVSTLEAAVVRISDRIAYLNHDLDDALRAGVITKIPDEFAKLGQTQGKRIGMMVCDVIANSLDQPAIVVSTPMLATMNRMKEWLFDEVYLAYPGRMPDIEKAQNLVIELYRYFRQEGRLPEGYVGKQGAVDYLAGMTDRFALELYRRLKLPDVWPLP